MIMVAMQTNAKRRELEMDEASTPDIMKPISQIYRKTQMYLNERVKPLGLTSGQAPFILLTCEQGKVAQHCFCAYLDMDKSTVAKTLFKLEQEGYVSRQPNDRDNRSTDVSPTEKARELYPALKRVGEEWALAVTDGMTQVERAIFFELLQKVVKNIGAYFQTSLG